MNNTQTKKGRKPKEKRYHSKFAEVLRALLAKKEDSGITLSAVADDLGITRQSLAQYRDGNNIPDIVILGRMADYFNATTDYLLGRTPYPTVDQDLRIAEEVTGLSQKSIENLQKSHAHLLNANLLLESDNFYSIIYYLTEIRKLIITKEYYSDVVSPILNGNSFYDNLTLNNICYSSEKCQKPGLWFRGCKNCLMKDLDINFIFDLICNSFPEIEVENAEVFPGSRPTYYTKSEHDYQEKIEVDEFRATKAFSSVFEDVSMTINYSLEYAEHNKKVRESLKDYIIALEKTISDTNTNEESKERCKKQIISIQTYLDKYDENFKLKGDTDNGSNNHQKE